MTPNRESAVERGRYPASSPAGGRTQRPPEEMATVGTPSAISSRPDDEPAPDTSSDLPRWFAVGVVSAAVLMASVGSFGLLLGINGWYRTWLVAAVTVPLTAVLVWGLFWRRPHRSVSRGAQVGAALALALALGYAAFVGVAPAQHVLANRDPAAYELVGRWLARSGSVDIDARGDAFGGIDGLVFRGAASYNVPDVPVGPDGRPLQPASGHLQMQFNHLSSAVLAAAYDVGGDQLFFRTPALAAAIGLLLVYAVAARATRKPLLSLLAPLVLAVSMPLLYVSRDTFSEPFALVALWGGLLVLLEAHERPRPWVGLVGGVLLGAVAGARVDALVYVILLFPLAAVSIAAAATRPVRRARAIAWTTAAVTTTLVTSIGWVDLTRHAGDYATSLGADLRVLRRAVVASLAASLAGLAIWFLVPVVRRAARRVQRPVAWIGAGLVVLLMLGLWLVRPHVQTVMASRLVPTTAEIQQRDGMPVEPRSYAEHSLWWMAWYLGIPTLVAAIAGLAVATWRSVRGRATAATAAVAVLTLGGGAVYWWDPSITPSQPWASRRFIPAVFPGLAIMAVVAVAALAMLPLVRRRGPAVRWTGAAVLAAALVLPAAITTWPVRWQRSEGGFLGPLTDTCDGMTGNPAVIVTGNYDSLTIQQMLRSWCGVPVAGQGSAFADKTPQQVAATLTARGYDLYLVSTETQTINNWAAQLGSRPEASRIATDDHTVEETLDKVPDGYVESQQTLPTGEPFALYRVRVPPAAG